MVWPHVTFAMHPLMHSIFSRHFSEQLWCVHVSTDSRVNTQYFPPSA
eukprot:COSAG06_NODE_3967_length_4710_cov_6.208415_7_plen_47_part_00